MSVRRSEAFKIHQGSLLCTVLACEVDGRTLESEVRTQDITLPCVPSHEYIGVGTRESFSNTTMYQHRK